MIRVALVTRAIDPAALIASIASTGYGAISLFAGTVRDTSDGRAVSAIVSATPPWPKRSSSNCASSDRLGHFTVVFMDRSVFPAESPSSR